MGWHPTLDDLDRRDDRPWTRPRRVTDTARRETRTPVIGTFDVCWCGQARDHDWPGKDSGQPHPRDRRAAA